MMYSVVLTQIFKKEEHTSGKGEFHLDRNPILERPLTKVNSIGDIPWGYIECLLEKGGKNDL